MPDIHPDLIAALAEGMLPAEEAARLQAAIASDPEAQLELELQRTALQALSEAPRPRLNDVERGRLRRAVAEVRPAEAAAPQRSPRRFSRLALAAALIVAAAAAAPLLTTLSRSGDEGSGDLTIAEAITTSSTALSDEPAVAGAAPEDGPDAAVATTLAPAQVPDDGDALPHVGDVTEETLQEMLITYAASFEVGGVGEEYRPTARIEADDTIVVEPDKCEVSDLLPDLALSPRWSARVDGRIVVVYVTIPDDGGPGALVTVDHEACQVTHTTELDG